MKIFTPLALAALAGTSLAFVPSHHLTTDISVVRRGPWNPAASTVKGRFQLAKEFERKTQLIQMADASAESTPERKGILEKVRIDGRPNNIFNSLIN